MKRFNATQIPEPEVHMRNNRECYYDFVSKQLRVKTPEEAVRQRLLRFLVDELDVPPGAIQVEVPMSRFIEGMRDRADVVIYGIANDNVAEPVAVIECKAPHIVLIDTVFAQVDRYAEALNAPISGVTNGEELIFDYWQEKESRYDRVTEIPTYTEMCRPENLQIIAPTTDKLPPYTVDEINSEAIYRDELSYGNIGEKTPHSLVPLVINLINCFLYDESECTGLTVFGHTFEQDLGVRFTSFNNASGGAGWTGEYRAFMLKDSEENAVIVSVSVMGMAGKGAGTVLVVAIDDFDKHHNSLQLNIDKYVHVKSGTATFTHNGRMSVSNLGSVRASDVVEFVGQRNPKIVVDGQVELGTFNIDGVLNVNAPDFTAFLGNVITYALLRDEFRVKFKETRKD